MERTCQYCGADLNGGEVCPKCGNVTRNNLQTHTETPKYEEKILETQKDIYRRVNECETHLRSIKAMLVFFTVLVSISLIISIIMAIIIGVKSVDTRKSYSYNYERMLDEQ